VRVAAVGDVHAGIDSADLLRPGFAQLSADADVLLIAGDLTQIGAPEEAKVLAGELEGIEIPVVAVLGNHDHHSDAADVVRDVLESVGVVVLDGETVTLDVGGRRLGVVGDTGFGGGFAGASGSAFGEPEMKTFMRRTERSA
jgi:Icc-related predicted phosphoesterase